MGVGHRFDRLVHRIKRGEVAEGNERMPWPRSVTRQCRTTDKCPGAKGPDVEGTSNVLIKCTG
jgi:hypothetical protein